MTVGVVVPAYNEEDDVGAVIDGLPEYVDRAYLVDDGSTDDTWAAIRRHAAKRNETHTGEFDRLVVPIQHEQNRGVGGAIKTGYQRAREEKIDATAVLGGDDQMDPAVLEKYFDPIADGDAEYVKGNRFARPEDWAEMPRFRLIGNVALSYLTKMASGYWGTMDSQNGYTVISLRALEATDIDGMYEYYGYCNDLLVRLNVANVTIADIPRSSEYAYSGGWKSHIDYKEYIPRVSVMLFRSFLWRLHRKYLMSTFNLLAPLYLSGIGGFAVGVLGVVRSLFGGSDEQTGTWVLTSIVSLLTILAGVELDRRDNERLEAHRETRDTSDSSDPTDAEQESADRPRKSTGDTSSQTDGDSSTMVDGSVVTNEQ